jgi:uncharacterized protein involved in exopolysaccharide biosynthesis
MPKNNKSLDTYEINLLDYIKIILKRKYWFFWIIISILILSLVSFVTMPKKYETEAVLKIGKIQGKSLSTTEEIVEILIRKPALLKIAENAGLKSPNQNNLNQLANNIDLEETKSGLLIIRCQQKNNPQKAKDLINAVIDFVIKNHKEVLEQKQKILNKKISQAQQELKDYEIQLEEVILLEKRFSLPNNESDALALQAYLAQKRELTRQIVSKKNKIDTLELQKIDSFNTSLISQPYLPELSQLRNLKIYLIIGFLAGIFISISWIFLLEWWQENKKKIWEK